MKRARARIERWPEGRSESFPKLASRVQSRQQNLRDIENLSSVGEEAPDLRLHMMRAAI
jgi:hypothetical protein